MSWQQIYDSFGSMVVSTALAAVPVVAMLVGLGFLHLIDAQSIVVASTATGWFNHEGDILRYVFFHSLALACLVGLFVTLQAYVVPFTSMVIR